MKQLIFTLVFALICAFTASATETPKPIKLENISKSYAIYQASTISADKTIKIGESAFVKLRPSPLQIDPGMFAAGLNNIIIPIKDRVCTITGYTQNFRYENNGVYQLVETHCYEVLYDINGLYIGETEYNSTDWLRLD